MGILNSVKLVLIITIFLIPIFLAFNATALTQSAGTAVGNINSSWALEGKNPENTWYSPQTMVNPANVGGLKPLWSAQLPYIAGTPVILHGMVYFSGGGYYPGNVYALNETTGKLIWVDGPYQRVALNFSTTAGVAVDNGSVFAGTSDNKLVSLNASTGALNWEVSITDGIVGNPAGYYLGPQAAPLVYDGKIMIADTEGDIGARGFLRAFSEANGQLLWTFYTVPPSPMTSTNQAFYHNTWGNCTECGGGDIWNVPAVDPSTGIIYFGTGNPAPDYNPQARAPYPNDTNLYADSVIALNSSSGQMIWYYQEFPAETHDWDQGMPVQIFNTTINGIPTKVVGAGGKGGYYFVLNATNGHLIYKVSVGMHLNDDANPTPQGVIVYPGSFGGINSFTTYDPMTNMVYAVAYNQPSNYTLGPVDFNNGQFEGSVDNSVPGYLNNSTLYAIDTSNGTIMWKMGMEGMGGGVSSTNNLVFTSDGNGSFYALNAETGKVLWQYNTGADFYIGLWTWGAPAITDGVVFETLIGSSSGGVMAFTTNTSVTESSYPTSLLSSTTTKVSNTTSTSSHHPSTTSTSTSSSTSLVQSSTTSPSFTTTTQFSSSVASAPDPNIQLAVATVIAVVLASSIAYVFGRQRPTTARKSPR